MSQDFGVLAWIGQLFTTELYPAVFARDKTEIERLFL
jgi:hypothetical protein